MNGVTFFSSRAKREKGRHPIRRKSGPLLDEHCIVGEPSGEVNPSEGRTGMRGRKKLKNAGNRK